eukprot:CAMPEP_0114651426 /NCGR_PEP_ID=MMETSP0191-20121206/8321_1 /TAXON_ID=126664 /ORGANISM="Sorites sp." /LENGTH=173 /DNA_ID=CAMNT_0001865607 /DNA_START=63 /DNA_END=585 /DNA_ORIENTATION=-
MPRSGARTSSSAPKRSAPPAAAPRHAPPPAAAPAAAPPATTGGGGMLSGLMGSMASGMATGVGFSVANRAVDAVMGPRQTEVVHRNEGAPAPVASAGVNCQVQNDQLMQCMKASSEASQCQFYLDALKAASSSSELSSSVGGIGQALLMVAKGLFVMLQLRWPASWLPQADHF